MLNPHNRESLVIIKLCIVAMCVMCGMVDRAKEREKRGKEQTYNIKFKKQASILNV